MKQTVTTTAELLRQCFGQTDRDPPRYVSFQSVQYVEQMEMTDKLNEAHNGKN